MGVATTPVWYFLIGVGPADHKLLLIVLGSIMAAFSFTTYANIVGCLSSTPIAAANFAEPLLTAMLLLNGIMIVRTRIKWLFFPFYYVNPQSYLCYIVVELVTADTNNGSDVMNYFHYSDGHVGRAFAALLAIDVGGVLLGYFVLTQTFAKTADAEAETVLDKVAKCVPILGGDEDGMVTQKAVDAGEAK